MCGFHTILGAQHESPPKVLRLLLISWNPFLGKASKQSMWCEKTASNQDQEIPTMRLKVFHQGTFGGSVQLSARSSIDLHESGLKETQFGLVQSEDRQERPWCTRQNALDIMSVHSQYDLIMQSFDKGLSFLFLRIPIRSEPTTVILPNADQHVWVLELTHMP